MKQIMAINAELVAALEAGYLYALGTAHDQHRMRNQAALCAMRDAICLETGRGAQDVQETFEELAILSKVQS